MEKIIELSFALKSDMMTTVRLTAGGVCARAGLSLDDGEDCKVCVTEGLLLLMRNGFSFARVFFSEEDGLYIRLKGEERSNSASETAEDEISYALLGALVDHLSVERKDGVVSEIAFRIGS